MEVLSLSIDVHDHDVRLAFSERLTASVAVGEGVVAHVSVPRRLFMKAATIPSQVMHPTVKNASKRRMNILLSFP